MSKKSRKSAATKVALWKMCQRDTPPNFNGLGLHNSSNPAVSKKNKTKTKLNSTSTKDNISNEQ